MKKRRSPSTGEQSAAAGYQRQYEYSACEIYRRMQGGDFRGISVADPDAGIFDDLVLHGHGKVRAIQVKSEENPQSIALNTELLSNKLMREIADAWRSIRNRFPEDRAKLLYIFGGYFSTSDIALANVGAEGSRHSAEFAQFLRHDDLTLEVLKRSAWSVKFSALQSLTGMSDEDFVALLNDLELHDYRELERNRIDHFQPDDRSSIQAIQGLLPRLVARRESRRFHSEADIVRELAWRKLTQKNSHDFPVPDIYQANHLTEELLRTALSNHTGGYISLVGPPGTGKSTLLQTALFSVPEYSVSRYLAYIPDNRHGLGRAEAGSFLNDLIAELKGLGFGGKYRPLDDLAGLRSEFLRQLEQAGKLYSETNRKTVIIIDGLDHVPREERPTASFLRELPAVQAIPDGVLIVLGTQTVDLEDLQPSIVQQAKATERCITIAPLSRASIFAMAAAAGLPDFVDPDDIHVACKGHPLTATYFINALKGAASRDAAARTLSQVEGLGRELSEIYGRVWSALGAEGEAKRALGLLARADGGLTPFQLAAVVGDQAVESVIKKAGFLLADVGGDRLSIFHNSFRLSVAQETGTRFGRPEPALDVEFNRSLAEIAATAPADDPQHWMELRYRARSGDANHVLQLGTPGYFRKSLAAFRPSSEIYVDLRLTYAAVKPTRSRVVLLNKLLIEKEIEYRLEAVRDLDLIDLFIDFDQIDLALKHALEVKGNGKGWLRLVDLLWEQGEHSLSRRVLEANEPLEVLFGKDAFNSRDQMVEAEEWIQRAQRFRPLDRLSSIVAMIPIDDRLQDVAAIREALLFRIASGVAQDRPDTEITELCNRLGLGSARALCLHIEAASQALNDGKHERAKLHLAAIEEQANLWCLYTSVTY